MVGMLETLVATECWQLLGTHEVGRVAFTERGLPVVLPVNYTLVGTGILLRCRADGLARRLDGEVVAFEVDEVDDWLQEGWSVVATGTANRLDRVGDLVRSDIAPPSWAGTDHQTAIRITVGDIQGRRLHATT